MIFMEAANIRQKLHHYVDSGDEKLLKLMYAIAKEYNDDDDFEYEFSAGELQLFEERRIKRISGKSKMYDWNEDKAIITGENKPE
jgi:hypothetical protein